MLYLIILAALGGTALVYKSSKKDGGASNAASSGSLPEGAALVSDVLKLDSGVSPQEAQAIANAINHEKFKKNLYDFGQAMLPDFPIAAAVLITKSGFIVRPKPPVRTTTNLQSGLSVKAGAAKSVAIASKVAASIQAGKTFRGISGMGADWDPTGITDVVEDTVKAGINIVTHPERSVSDAWDALTHPADSLSTFAGNLVDVLHKIPGMDWAGEQLKDFAKTGLGEWCLRIMATYGYFVTAPFLGAQMAAISFALPGIMKADPFLESWMKETIDRVMKTVQILLLNQVKLDSIGDAGSEALNKFLADNPAVQELVNKLMAQTSTGIATLKSKLGEELVKKIQDGVEGAITEAGEKLAAEYGLPPDFAKIAAEAGIREDSAAAAYDLIAHTDYQSKMNWDAKTGKDIISHLRKAKAGSVTTASTSATTKLYSDPRNTNVFQATSNRGAKAAERQKWVNKYLGQA